MMYKGSRYVHGRMEKENAASCIWLMEEQRGGRKLVIRLSTNRGWHRGHWDNLGQHWSERSSKDLRKGAGYRHSPVPSVAAGCLMISQCVEPSRQWLKEELPTTKLAGGVDRVFLSLCFGLRPAFFCPVFWLSPSIFFAIFPLLSNWAFSFRVPPPSPVSSRPRTALATGCARFIQTHTLE